MGRKGKKPTYKLTFTCHAIVTNFLNSLYFVLNIIDFCDKRLKHKECSKLKIVDVTLCFIEQIDNFMLDEKSDPI